MIKRQRKMLFALMSMCLVLIIMLAPAKAHADSTVGAGLITKIHSVCKNAAEVTVGLKNAGALDGKWSRLVAQIYDGAEIKYTLNNCSLADFTDTDECTINFEIENGIQLPYGKYTMNVLLYDENGSNPQLLDTANGNEFYVTSKVNVGHGVNGQYELNSTTYFAIADSPDYNWEAGEPVDIEIDSVNEPIHSIVGSDNKIEFNISTGAAITINTWEKVEIYRSSDRALLAIGEFTPEINAIICNGYYTRNISLIGYFLKKCDNDSTYAELYDGNTKLDIVNKHSFSDNLLFLHFNYNLELGKDYTIKLYSNGRQITSLPDNGNFRVVPLLNSDRLIIPGTTTGDSITLFESSDSCYQWNAGDNVYLAVGRPDTNYAAAINSGIVVGDSSVQFTTAQIAAADGHPLQKGQYSFALRKASNNAALGYTTISVGAETDFLTGTLYSSDGQTSRGAIIIEKDNAGWGDEITVPDNGMFCYPLEKLRGAGTYTLRGIPANGSADAVSVNRLDWNGTDALNAYTVTLNKTQVTGVITEAVAGYVTVLDENWNYMFKVQVNNGSFNIGGLEAGKKYNILAEADLNTNYIDAIPQSVEITSDTVNNPITLNFTLRQPQITGSVFSADGNTPLEENTYQVEVRALDGHGINNTAFKAKRGMFVYCGLEPGEYSLTIIPNSDSSYSESFSQEFSIAEDGTAVQNNFVMRLTYPKLTGTVINNTGKTFIGNWIDIFEGYGNQSRYITGMGIGQEGAFKIGALQAGKYYIRAGAEDSFSLRTYSAMTEVDLTSEPVSGVVLELNERTLRILNINPYTAGDNTLSVRLQNVDLLNGDLSGLEAEIIDAGGNALTTLSGSYLSLDEGSLFDEDQDLRIQIPNDIVLTPGYYKLKLRYQGEELETNWQNGDSFKSVYGFDLEPYQIIPSEASQKAIIIRTSKDPDSALPDAWTGTDALTVKMYDMDDTEHTLSNIAINADNSITAVLPSAGQLPEGKYSEGWYRLEVYRADEVIARRYLNIVTPEIRSIWNINSESDSVGIEGDGLSAYIEGGAVADIYNSSNELVQSVSKVINNWGTMQYFFKDKLRPGQYTLKLHYKGTYIELPDDGRFNVVPMLGATPLYIDSSHAQEIITFELKDSRIAPPWSSSDAVTVKLSSGSGAINIDSSELTISEKGISFSLPTGLAGELWAEIFNGSELIANSKIYVYGNAQLKANIKDTHGNAVPYARVIVDKKDYSSSYGFDADKNGDTVVCNLEPGEYYIRAATNNIGAYIDSQADMLLIKDDGMAEINGADITETIGYTLAEAKVISGTLSLPEGKAAPAGGIHAWIFVEKNDGEKGYGTEVFIPEGAGSAEYTLPVLKEYTGYMLQYWVDGNGNNYVNHGYYSAAGTVFTADTADNFTGTGEDMANMNIVLVEGTRISGTVVLPAGIENTDDISIYIEAKKAGNANDDIIVGYEVIIPANSDSAQYSLIVPKESGYTVSYTADDKYGFENNGYYSSNGTVQDPSLATVIDAAEEDKSDIKLDINRRQYTITIKLFDTDPASNPSAVFTTANKDVWQTFAGNGRYIIELKDAYGNVVTKEITISDINTASVPEP